MTTDTAPATVQETTPQDAAPSADAPVPTGRANEGPAPTAEHLDAADRAAFNKAMGIEQAPDASQPPEGAGEQPTERKPEAPDNSKLAESLNLSDHWPNLSKNLQAKFRADPIATASQVIQRSGMDMKVAAEWLKNNPQSFVDYGLAVAADQVFKERLASRTQPGQPPERRQPPEGERQPAAVTQGVGQRITAITGKLMDPASEEGKQFSGELEQFARELTSPYEQRLAAIEGYMRQAQAASVDQQLDSFIGQAAKGDYKQLADPTVRDTVLAEYDRQAMATLPDGRQLHGSVKEAWEASLQKLFGGQTRQQIEQQTEQRIITQHQQRRASAPIRAKAGPSTQELSQADAEDLRRFRESRAKNGVT